MKVLDDRFYPHIVDQIWSFMNYPDYLIGRQVSKSWKKRADTRLSLEESLSRHISISFTRASPRQLSKSSGSRNSPALPLLNGFTDRKGKGKAKASSLDGRLEELRDGTVDIVEIRSRDVFYPERSVCLSYEPLSFWDFSGKPELENKWSLLLAKTELVDFFNIASFVDGRDFGRLPSMIDPTATVRWYQSPDSRPQLSDHSAQVVFCTLDATRLLGVPKLRIRTAGLAELVINVDCFTNPLHEASLEGLNGILDLPTFIKEWGMITMILNNRISPKEKAKDTRPGYTSVGLMINFIETARELRLPMRVVGVERFLDDPDLWDTLLFRVREQMEDPHERSDLVTFWTHEDYKMQYGLEQYLTHTSR